MYKLCVGSNLYASHSLETALSEISNHGIHAVDLWASPTLCDHINPDRDDPVAIKKLLEKYEIEPVSLTSFLIDDDKRLSRMQFAKEIGAPVVIWEPAQSPDWKDNMKNLREDSIPFCNPKGCMEDYWAKLKWYLEKATTLGLKVGIEVPHRYTFNEYLYQIWRTDKAIENDNLCAVIAPPHADARGYDASDVFDIIGNKRSWMLYLWDVQKNYSFPSSDGAFGTGIEQMPGGGRRDFKKMIDHFVSGGFDGWFNISCHGVEGWTDLDLMDQCLTTAIETFKKAIV